MSGARKFGTRAVVAAAAGALALASWAAVVVRVATPPARVALADELSLGAQFADSLERALARAPAPGETIDARDALAATYLQRLRLGLGSPFRLVDFVVRDPLLRSEHRRPLAEAILARTALGHAYETPGAALQLLARDPGDAVGDAHRELMQRVTSEAESPRAAELALRLAYGIGSSAGTVSHRAGAVAVGAIALARDRALAMRDVEALLEEARRNRLRPVDLVPLWRASRQFTVEAPLLDPPTAADERAAVALLPLLARELEALDGADPAKQRPRIGAAAAEQAVRAVAKRNAPPQAPIAVTLGGYTSFVVGSSRTQKERVARSAFMSRARNEEALAAEFVQLEATFGPTIEVSLALVTAAVSLRAYAQEQAWLPGDVGPSALQLQSQLGLASLTFDENVPASWRPYFTRMLSQAVTDLRGVIPRLDLTGLNVHFGDSPLKERALALHDPGARRIFFPLATGAGAMAHEIAHDLDWQAARRRYGVKGGYRTDRSARQFEDGLSSTVRRMASAGRPRSGATAGPGTALHADRPTEAFARGVDWFVASALAHQGRLNGYLSSVQDEMLTGYASATPPRPGTSNADATLEALREITQVEPSLLTWYEATYGSGRRLGISDAVRRVLVAPVPRVDVRGTGLEGVNAFSRTSRMLQASPETGAGWSCLLDSPSLRGRDAAALREAMFLAADARARGLVRRWGEYSRSRSDASWLFRALGGAPWDPAIADSLVREVRDGVLWRAARVDVSGAGAGLSERAERRAAWESCARGN